MYPQLWFWIKMPKPKKEAVSFSEYERQKLQRMYKQGGAAFGSVRNLKKASFLPVSKVRLFLHSKHIYTKITLATRKFKRMKAFARFKIEIWCMDLAYNHKLARDNNVVKYLLVRQDMFNRIVNGKEMKTKDSRETVREFLTTITKMNWPKNFWVVEGTEFDRDFKTFCSAEGIQVYTTISETKAAFAERTIRSLKNILYRYMEDYGYKYFHKLSQFFTTLNYKKNCSIDLVKRNIKKSILYNSHFENRGNPRLKRETEFASRLEAWFTIQEGL